MKIELYTDGSATTADKPGGYGYVIVIDGKKHSEGSGPMLLATNNDAEMEAAIEGLKAVKTLFIENFNEMIGVDIELVSDSQLILGWVSGTYQFKQQKKMQKYTELRNLARGLKVKGRWVAGHTGDTHNERCDQLANAARLTLVPEAEQGKKKNKVKATEALHEARQLLTSIYDYFKNIDCLKECDPSVNFHQPECCIAQSSKKWLDKYGEQS